MNPRSSGNVGRRKLFTELIGTANEDVLGQFQELEFSRSARPIPVKSKIHRRQLGVSLGQRGSRFKAVIAADPRAILPFGFIAGNSRAFALSA